MEATYNVVGIDVHKKMLAVVITNARHGVDVRGPAIRYNIERITPVV